MLAVASSLKTCAGAPAVLACRVASHLQTASKQAAPSAAPSTADGAASAARAAKSHAQQLATQSQATAEGCGRSKRPTDVSVADELKAYLSSSPTARQIAAALIPGQGVSRVPDDPHTLAMQQMLLATGLLEEKELREILAVVKG